MLANLVMFVLFPSLLVGIVLRQVHVSRTGITVRGMRLLAIIVFIIGLFISLFVTHFWVDDCDLRPNKIHNGCSISWHN